MNWTKNKEMGLLDGLCISWGPSNRLRTGINTQMLGSLLFDFQDSYGELALCERRHKAALIHSRGEKKLVSTQQETRCHSQTTYSFKRV